MRARGSILSAAGVLLLVGTSACVTRWAGQPEPYRRDGTIKPVVAVARFENRSSFAGKWNLGDGMAELLTARLLQTDRLVVLERRHIDDLLQELVRQGKDLFRQEGRAERGRLMNARYIVSGVITDFTVVGDASGWFGAQRSFRIWGRGRRARVALNVKVSDVETGVVVASVNAARSVSSGGFGGDVEYRKLNFGGDAYFNTPLGRATEKAIRDAVKRVLRILPEEPWQARVAEGNGSLVVINGGENVGLRPGARFRVREEPRPITDPVTGNVIDRVPGGVIGLVRVTHVRETASTGAVEQGVARRGDLLEWIEEETP